MSVFSLNGSVMTFNNRVLSTQGSGPTPPPEPTMVTYSGVKSLLQNGSFAQGFNGIGSKWDTWGSKKCADVLNKTLTVNITGSDVSFKIIDWYRSGSDYNGTATIDTTFTSPSGTYTWPSLLPDDELRAYGDYSTIYMTWSAQYPSGTDVRVSAGINGGTQYMFEYSGGTAI